jgi:phosphoserine phosphatase
MTLVAFDFDGTLSDSEMTVLLGEQAGVAAEIAAITDRAMAGELSYAASLRERVQLLSGLPTAAMEAAFAQVRLHPGAAALLGRLRAAGVPVVILTGGFERGVDAALAAADAAVDAVVANRLVVADGSLTGAVTGPLIAGTKDTALAEVCARWGTSPADAVAVGDGANDLPMLEAAGTAIGYEPKPVAAGAADHIVHDMDELGALLAARGLW